MSIVRELASAQLDAYNRADLEAFCACYAEDVVVLDEGGAVRTRGLDAFREGYRELFARHRDVRATVTQRLVLGRHAIDLEGWSRVDAATGERTEGEVLVRYTERDGHVAIVEFLR